MFRGINAINVDVKGRLSIPTRYRARLQDECYGQMVVTIDPIDPEERCLLLYPLTEWEVVERKIESLPSFNRTARRIQRLLIGHAEEVKLDDHGRVLVPPLLRQYAQIEKRIMLIGQGKKFEIWTASRWQEGRDTWLAEAVGAGGEVPEELRLLSL